MKEQIIQFLKNLGLMCGLLPVLTENHEQEKKIRVSMKDSKSTMHKTIGCTTLAYSAFTTISIIGPIILERFWSRHR